MLGDQAAKHSVKPSRRQGQGVRQIMAEEADVSVPQHPDVGDVEPGHGQAVVAASEGEPRVALGIVAHPPEDVGMNHSGAHHLEPPLESARGTARSLAVEAQGACRQASATHKVHRKAVGRNRRTARWGSRLGREFRTGSIIAVPRRSFLNRRDGLSRLQVRTEREDRPTVSRKNAYSSVASRRDILDSRITIMMGVTKRKPM